MILSDKTLKSIAAQASQNYRQELELYGYANEEFVITPAMVRTIIAVLETIADAPDPATTPSPSGEGEVFPNAAWGDYTNRHKATTPSPPGEGGGGVLTSPRQMREQRAAVSDEAIFAAIRAIAVDGVMPSQVQYNLRRPINYPTDAHVRKRLKTTWRKLAFRLNLLPNRTFEDRHTTLREVTVAPAAAAPFSDGEPNHAGFLATATAIDPVTGAITDQLNGRIIGQAR